jgi:predicted ABC-type ATPase
VACIEQGVDFLVETVLYSDKYLDDVERALLLGYRIGVIYVGLATPEDSANRVALRLRRGGHGVPIDRIMARWARAIAMLGKVAPFSHRLYVYDNSGTSGPILIARKVGPGIELLVRGRIPEIDAVLDAANNTSA